MTTTEKNCRDLWRKLVKRDGYCEICGDPNNLHAHHPFGKKCHATIVFNPLLGVSLCGFPKQPNCHDRFGQENLDGLLAELLPILRIKDPERFTLLDLTAQTYKRTNHARADYQQIYAELQRFEREHGTDWMDQF